MEMGLMPRSIPRWLIVLIGLVILVVVGSAVLFSVRVTEQAERSQANVAAHGTTPPLTTGTGNKSVFLIVMENHNWSDIKHNPSAPYINQALLPMASYSEQYFNPPGNHPSEPNYLWLEAGTKFGISNDADPVANHQSTTQHFVTLLNNAHISWKSYQESMSSTVC